MSVKPKSNLLTRFLTALVGIPAIFAIVYEGPPWAWFAFVCVATMVGAVELFGMTHPGDRPSQVVGMLLTLGTMLVLWLSEGDARALLALVMLLPILGLFTTLARLGDIKTATLRVATLSFGPLYLGAGIGSIALLRRDAGSDGPGYVLLVFMLAWMSDTGAYFAGRFLGKHKLFPAVSPKKTVEGALGGLAGAVVGSLLAHFVYLTSLPLLDGLALAIIGGGLGQAGDLGESMLKRSASVKDSGGIVPGHGGILDRTDALLVASVITYVYVLLIRAV